MVVIVLVSVFKNKLKTLMDRIATIKFPGGELSTISQVIDHTEKTGLEEPPPDLPEGHISLEQQELVRSFVQAQQATIRLWEYTTHGFGLVLENAPPVGVHDPEVELRSGVTLVGGQTVPAHGSRAGGRRCPKQSRSQVTPGANTALVPCSPKVRHRRGSPRNASVPRSVNAGRGGSFCWAATSSTSQPPTLPQRNVC